MHSDDTYMYKQDGFVASTSQEHRTFQNMRQGGERKVGVLCKFRYLDSEARVGGL